MEHWLVIVDMQPRFEAATYKEVRKEVVAEIKRTKANRILLVEYLPCRWNIQDKHSCTCKEIVDAILEKFQDGFGMHFRIFKQDDDGSKAIQEVMSRESSPDVIQLVGVNLSACVAATAEGLAGVYPNSRIEVIEAACGDDWSMVKGRESVQRIAEVCQNVRLVSCAEQPVGITA
jgi:hypothetical protein